MAWTKTPLNLKGPKGEKGDTGATGAKGDAGATGATGATGPRGSQWFDGTGAPSGISGSQPGDRYLDNATGDVYLLS